MTTILVDGNNLAIASFFVSSELRDPQGRPSGAIYGFCRSLRPILNRIQQSYPNDPVKVIVAWDGGNYWRKDVLPSYKASRAQKKEDGGPDPLENYYEQVPRLKDILRILGVGQFTASAYEADDIAGMFAQMPGHVVLVSNDEDWFQLVNQTTHLWRPTKEQYVTLENFEEITECVTPDEFAEMKAIMGDKGDDVPGAIGVGPKFALRYLRGELTKGKKFDAIKAWMENPDGYARTKTLVDLRSMTIPHANWRLTEGTFNQQVLIETFMELAFDSILADVTGWIRPFRMTTIQKAAA